MVVVGAATVLLLQRPKGTDLSSVKKYHSALGTIEHISERTMQPPGKVATSPGGPSGAGAVGRSVPPVPVRGSGDFPDPEAPIVFDDSRPRDHYEPQSHFDSEGPTRFGSLHNRAERQALDSMNHRPRRTTWLMVGVIVLVLFGTLFLIGSHHPKSKTGAGRTSRSSSVSDTSSSVGSQNSGGGDHKNHNKHHDKHGQQSPPTTQPGSQVVALSSTGATAVYPAAADSYQVTVDATGPCWVLATSSSTGSVLWTGTMQAGQTQPIQANGTVTVELGSATCAMKLDNLPVVFPTPESTPFIATFQPSADANSTTSSTTSSSTVPSTSGGQ